MAIDKNLVDSLRTLGFSEYSAKVYTALLSLGASSAADIAMASGVPQAKVYSVLQSLEKEGMISTQPGERPARYRPMSPEFFLTKKKKEYESAFDTAESRLIPLYERASQYQLPDIWILRETHSVYSKLVEMIKNTESEIILGCDTLFDLKIGGVLEQLKMKKEENPELEIRIVTSSKGIDDQYELDVLEELEGVAETKVRERAFNAIFLVCDAKEMLQGSYARIGGEVELGLISIWTDNKEFSQLWKEFTDYIWKDSKKINLKPNMEP